MLYLSVCKPLHAAILSGDLTNVDPTHANIHLVIQVYRMDPNEIGCSLAEAAETPLYNDYLAAAAHTGQPAMHVVYINTSLKTKATAHAVVPTITCTSSNVVQTVLQVSCCCRHYVHALGLTSKPISYFHADPYADLQTVFTTV